MSAGEPHSRSLFTLGASVGILALYVGTLLLCRDGVVADGYDGVGFVLALRSFDLARFTPQPPGYPLFVLAGRGLQGLGMPAGLAVALPSALLLGLGLGAVAGRLAAALGRWVALLFVLLVPTAPLAYGLGMATLSDGAGLGMLLITVAAAVDGVTRCPASPGQNAWVGVLGGLTLGFRPPLLPLFVLSLGLVYFDAAQSRWRGLLALLGGLFAAVLGWLLPLAWIVGAVPLFRLTLSHVHGHFSDFGGAAAAVTAAPPLARFAGFLHGLYQGGFGRLGGVLLLLALLSVYRQNPTGTGAVGGALGRRLLGLCAVYGVWTLYTLPVDGHGRHLLPLALACSTLLVLALSGLSRTRLERAAIFAVVALSAVDNGRAAWAFRKTPPPGAALATYVAKTAPTSRFYGARAARYLDLYLGNGSARPAVYLGEVNADLERIDNLPAEVLLTSEVLAAPASRARLRSLARFCYPDSVPAVLRFDRAPTRADASAGDCVELLAYRVRS